MPLLLDLVSSELGVAVEAGDALPVIVGRAAIVPQGPTLPQMMRIFFRHLSALTATHWNSPTCINSTAAKLVRWEA